MKPSKDEIYDNDEIFSPEIDPEIEKLYSNDDIFSDKIEPELQQAGLDEGTAQSLQDKIGENFEPISDATAGAAQGALMGFGDELGGVFQAGIDKIHGLFGDSVTDVDKRLAEQGFTGDLTPTSEQLYKEGQQETLEDLRQAEERSPMAYTLGEIGGGIGSGLALPAVGTGVKGAAATGAMFGGLTGIGQSNADMTGDTKEYLKQIGSDALTGATGGAILGGALGGVAKGAEKFADYLSTFKKNSYLKGIGRAFQLGKEGYEIRPANKIESTDPNKLNPLDLKQAKIQDLTDRIINADRALGENVGRSIQNAQEKGIRINLDDELEQTLKGLDRIEKDFRNITGEKEIINAKGLLERIKKGSKLGEDAAQKILDAVEAGKLDVFEAQEMIADASGQVTPVTLKGIMDELENMINVYKNRKDIGSASHRTIRELQDFRNQLNAKLKEAIPEYKQAAERFYEFRKNVPEVLMGKGETGEYNTSRFSRIKSEERPKKIFEKLDESIDDLAISQQNKVGSTKFRNIRKYLQDIEKRDPEILEKMGFKGEQDFVDKLDDVQELTDTLVRGKAANKLDPTRSTNIGAVREGLNTSFGDKFIIGASNKAGLSANKGVIRKASDLYNASKSQLVKAADTLRSSKIKGLGKIGESLDKAIKDQDQAKVKSTLFVILQRPDARKALGVELDED